jgi:hypothetical protein
MTIAIRKLSFISKRSTLGAVPSLKPYEWDSFYTKAIENVQPGITRIAVHLAIMRRRCRRSQSTIQTTLPLGVSAIWILHEQESEGTAGKNDIHLVNWRELGKLLQRL